MGKNSALECILYIILDLHKFTHSVDHDGFPHAEPGVAIFKLLLPGHVQKRENRNKMCTDIDDKTSSRDARNKSRICTDDETRRRVVETSKPTLLFLEETVGVFADYF